MRRILLTLFAAGAVLGAVPAVSLAGGGDHHRGDRHREREHQRRHDHARLHHERFGQVVGKHAGGDVGTVLSFAGGRLTIRLNDGSSVSGAVNRFTEVECEMPGSGSSGSGGPGPGDDNDIGDDHGGQADDGPGHEGHGHDGRGHDGQGGPGHDGRRHDGDRDRHRCAMVAPGTVVRDATLALTRFGAVWDRVDLIES